MNENEKEDKTGMIVNAKEKKVVHVMAKEDFVHVCFDLETFGLSHNNHEIIEIYLATIHGKEKESGKESFHHFMKPANGVGDPHLIHGITDDHKCLKNAEGFKKIETDMMKFIDDEVKHFEDKNHSNFAGNVGYSQWQCF